jgi:hypothetical protein
MTFLHCLEEIKEMEVGGTTSCILHNFFSKVIITLRGLDNITNFNERNITQYLVFEGIDVSLPWQSHPMVYGCGCGVFIRASRFMTSAEMTLF